MFYRASRLEPAQTPIYQIYKERLGFNVHA